MSAPVKSCDRLGMPGHQLVKKLACLWIGVEVIEKLHSEQVLERRLAGPNTIFQTSEDLVVNAARPERKGATGSSGFQQGRHRRQLKAAWFEFGEYAKAGKGAK